MNESNDKKIEEAYSRNIDNPTLNALKNFSRTGKKFGFQIACLQDEMSRTVLIGDAARLLLYLSDTYPIDDIPDVLIPDRDTALYNDAEQLLDNCLIENTNSSPGSTR